METKDARNTVTTEQLTKNLLKSIRKGHKQYKSRVKEEAKLQAQAEMQAHTWDRFGGHCKDCGCSAYGEEASNICHKDGRFWSY